MANQVRSVCLTFDVDYTDYYSGNEYDEMSLVFPLIQKVLLEFPQIKTTWFIRIDSQIEALFGQADHLFVKHKKEIQWLKENGHEIGWHHHSYKRTGIHWQQETEENIIEHQLLSYGKIAKQYDLSSTRMGWGFHTNKTMQRLSDLGFKTDSSAIPRPNYKWETTKKDWSITPQHPYFPSVNDYRRSDLKSLPILEVPISTVQLSAEGDTEATMMRYVNPAYYYEKFSEAVGRLTTDCLIAITHPYELVKTGTSSSLISFKLDEFKRNLIYLMEKGCSFITIDAYSNQFKKANSNRSGIVKE